MKHSVDEISGQHQLEKLNNCALSFNFYSPTRLIFGDEASLQAAGELNDLGARKTLLVTDKTLAQTEAFKAIFSSFADNGYASPIVFDSVPPESNLLCVHEGLRLAKKFGCDSIMSVGGGSVLDTAKAIDICLSLDGDILEFQGINNLSGKLKPMLAIPTTAGTGSEVSMVALIKDEAGEKLLYASKYLAPDIAVLDPGLIVSLPPRLTAGTGFDAITHAIEAFTAKYNQSPLVKFYCLEALKLLFENLPIAYRQGENKDARALCLLASCMAGIAFTNTGVGVVHALAHTIGAKHCTHHGMTNAVILPYGMEFNLPEAAPQYAEMARYLKIGSPDLDELALAQALIKKIRDLMVEVNLPKSLKELGISDLDKGSIEDLGFHALTDPAIMFNIKDVAQEDLCSIIKRTC